MAEWRFDQGRLDYFQIDEIKKIACAIASIDGVEKPTVEFDVLRQALSKCTQLPFLPLNYTVWRNYGRVFKCMMLAAEVDGHIYATDLCKLIAADPSELDTDDYLAHFAKNFCYQSPAFRDYVGTGPQTYPVLAIIKFLISEYLVRGKDYISLDEIAHYLIANSVSGLEDLNSFGALKSRPIGSIDIRQTRELVKFISQFSFLKWENPNLYLEVKNKDELNAIESGLQPEIGVREMSPDLEVLRIGGGFTPGAVGDVTLKGMETLEEEFTEGKKIRVTHLRTERSAKLRDLFFSVSPAPEICDMCEMDTSHRYPWTSHVIELHHLLPLASPVRVEGDKTSVKDLVGLCPSCHRATHRYYATWFKAEGLTDFRSYGEAEAVYQSACEKIVV